MFFLKKIPYEKRTSFDKLFINYNLLKTKSKLWNKLVNEDFFLNYTKFINLSNKKKNLNKEELLNVYKRILKQVKVLKKTKIYYNNSSLAELIFNIDSIVNLKFPNFLKVGKLIYPNDKAKEKTIKLKNLIK